MLLICSEHSFMFSSTQFLGWAISKMIDDSDLALDYQLQTPNSSAKSQDSSWGKQVRNQKPALP